MKSPGFSKLFGSVPSLLAQFREHGTLSAAMISRRASKRCQKSADKSDEIFNSRALASLQRRAGDQRRQCRRANCRYAGSRARRVDRRGDANFADVRAPCAMAATREYALVVAHLDDQPSVTHAPGADANASGSVSVLIAAVSFRADTALRLFHWRRARFVRQ
jgi:hypothetical protein